MGYRFFFDVCKFFVWDVDFEDLGFNICWVDKFGVKEENLLFYELNVDFQFFKFLVDELEV